MEIIKYLIFILFLYSCASIKPPPGGPIDETPPNIISVNPSSGTTGLTSNKITVKFSEYMDESSFKNNYSVYPRLENSLKFKFKGDEVIFILPDSLDSEKTYIIYLNRNIKDEHGVPLAKTIQLAYSSGSKISSGVLSGRVYGSVQSSVHLWDIDGHMPDSIFTVQPDYITDVDEDGRYSFNYLVPGDYQVLAVEKSGSGLPLNTERTGYGLNWYSKLNLSENDTLSNIDMRIWKEPQELKLLRGEWSAFNWGKLIFNNDLLESLTVDLQLESTGGTNLDSLQYYLDPMDQKNLIIQIFDSFTQKSLNVNIGSIKLDEELLLDSSNVVIQIPQDSDTSYLQILNPTQNLRITPNSLVGKELDIIFSKPVYLSEDSLFTPKLFQNDTISIIANIKQVNPMQLQLIPTLQWEENEKYQLKISQRGVTPEMGRGLKDSIITINLQTIKRTGYGSVVGKINEIGQSNLIAELFSTKNPSLSHTSIVNYKSEFEFKIIPEGDYSLYFYNDDDENMKYNFGNAYPSKPSEWFYFYPDTFEVRANWETEIAPIILQGVN
jgi:hypothetical protein